MAKNLLSCESLLTIIGMLVSIFIGYMVLKRWGLLKLKEVESMLNVNSETPCGSTKGYTTCMKKRGCLWLPQQRCTDATDRCYSVSNFDDCQIKPGCEWLSTRGCIPAGTARAHMQNGGKGEHL